MRKFQYQLKSIKIDGFWSQYTIQTEFNSDVNIFIGKNGTGKTTFINILKAVLTVDLPLIRKQTFSNIDIELMYKRKIRKIKVSREEEIYPFEMLKYKIGNRVFRIPIILGEYGYKRVHPKYIDTLKELNSVMDELVNVSWLSVHREILTEFEIEEELRMDVGTPVDHRLDELMRQFTRYQLKLESRARECSNKFQRDVLTSTLYDENLDRFNIFDLDFQLTKEKTGLIHAFEELGVPVDAEKIKKHINEIEKSINIVKKTSDGGSENRLTIDDVLPLSLLQRTQYIIELSRDAERDKREIFKPINEFLGWLHKFVEKKEFILGSEGKLLVKIRDTDQELGIEQLSSGEKQLLILLTETLLQENQPFIFIADEPELSLHIEWQEKLLAAIRSLNNNAQLIMATHSPEIVSEFKISTSNMESIFIE